MDEKPEVWGKDKLSEWKTFWESEMGEEAKKKMKRLKEQCLDGAMRSSDPDVANFYIGRAAGIDIVLQDIQAGIDSLDQLKKEEEKAKGKE